ncbi:MAG TPA: isocitrate lyase/phosphoenolpyruvate mutase family protein, partial [Acidimicrobiales bacterium]|nr:isocitrate lyase/phosphoenolpyruvate mutase family protein [Acidimicrobiales bacterium]
MHEQMRAGDEVGAGGGSPARPAHQARPAQQAADRPDLATRFLELHRPGDPLLIPNPFDEGSARLLAHLGFEALATTSSGCAASRGLLDGSVSRDDALAHAALIAAATELPVSADLENGFARQPDEVAETYRLARETGLAGASIEDYDPETGELYDIGLATERVAAAAEASHSGRPGGGRLVL